MLRLKKSLLNSCLRELKKLELLSLGSMSVPIRDIGRIDIIKYVFLKWYSVCKVENN